jgi:mono/diheme cytochrome c family protein
MVFVTDNVRATFFLALVWLVVVIQTACGGSATAPTGLTPTSSASSGQSAGLSAIQTQIFTPKCVGCHGNVIKQAGLNLASGSSFSNLVNVKSTETLLTLVIPSDPDGSYLLHKLEGRAGIAGERMPKGGPFLSSDEVKTVSQWIADGALDD